MSTVLKHTYTLLKEGLRIYKCQLECRNSDPLCSVSKEWEMEQTVLKTDVGGLWYLKL